MNIRLCRLIITYFVLVMVGITNIACTKNVHNNTALPATDTVVIPKPDTMPTAVKDTALITYLALGDSYTIGQSVAETERFPAQAVAQLRAGYINMGNPQYIATTGWTTSNLAQAIQQQQPKGPFGVVTLLIGVNDQYQHMDTGGYRTRFAQLLQTAIALAGNRKSRVFVLSIPDYSVTPFGGGLQRIHDEIDEFNAINEEITLDYGVKYINITSISRLAANDPSLIAGDGLHPSGKQYKLWVDALVPVMMKALK
jgi:lysophospholipase L1-like esterase